MNCNCQKIYKSNTVTIDTTNLVVTFNTNPVNITDKNSFNFIICQSIPDNAGTDPVLLTINGVQVPLWDRFGDIITADKLKVGYIYKGYYGVQNTSPHVIAINTPQCVVNYYYN